jgi:UTP--glucose-1-phosphate uridylyltransferase
VFRGRRYDTGDRADWIKANVLLGVDHEELGEEISSWIIDFADRLRARRSDG